MECKTCGQEVRVLKVGDRVEAIGRVKGLNLKGRRGIVAQITKVNWTHPVLVEFDDTGEFTNILRYGRYGRHEDFKVIKEKKKGANNS